MTLSRDPAAPPEVTAPDVTVPGPDMPEPPTLRRLRLLVTTLMVVLILGMVSIVAVLVIRLGGFGAVGQIATVADPIAADRFALPEGAEVRALGRGPGVVLIWLRQPDGSEMLHEYEAVGGGLRSATPIRREPAQAPTSGG